jgi:ABC-2 type transport system permease protein
MNVGTRDRADDVTRGGIGRLVRAELAKIASVRTPRWVLVAQVALLVAAASGAVASGGIPAERLATPEGLRLLLAHGGVVAILSLAVGITVSAGEYRHGTVVDTLLTEPRRERVVVAKVAAGLVAGAVAGAVVAATTLAVGLAWCAAEDVAFDWAVGWRSALGVLLWQALYAALGVGIGSVVTAQAAAVVTAVAWVFVAETALGQLVGGVARWLPATAASALGNAPGDDLLPQLAGGLVLAAWTTVVAGAAVLLTHRRDVVA